MALTGEKKKVYQQRYMRTYMRERRLAIKLMLANRYGFPVKIPRVDADGYVIHEY